MSNALVGIIMGSDSDLPVMQATAKTLEEFDVPYEISVLSAHRTPDKTHEYVTTAKERGLKVIIAAAGGAAHLAGVTAANTTLPVIGVPIKSNLDGIDSLLSTMQMPPGIPVATVAIDGAKNSALLAIQILALSDGNLSQKFSEYKNRLGDQVMAKTEKLHKVGLDEYLKGMQK